MVGLLPGLKALNSSKRVRVALLALAMSVPATVTGQGRMPAEDRDSARARLVGDVAFLASEKLAGRATGSPGGDSTANYLARSYVAMQVDAGFRTTQCDSTGACRRSYLQPFLPPTAILKAAGIDSSARAYNVLAIVPGTDSAVSREWVVVGAHHDHLGRTGYGARDTRSASQAHLGADDNASGTAAVLEKDDTAERIDFDGLLRVVEFAERLVRLLGDGATVPARSARPQ